MIDYPYFSLRELRATVYVAFPQNDGGYVT